MQLRIDILLIKWRADRLLVLEWSVIDVTMSLSIVNN
jgi:hypothetical protein